MSLANGQCAHQWPNAGRCLDLAITTREIPAGSHNECFVIYNVPLCKDHAGFYDEHFARKA